MSGPKIYADVAQGSLEWSRLHWGRPTASQFARFMTTKFELRDSTPVNTYLYERLAEKIMNHALPGFSSFATDQGTIREEQARPFYALEYDVDIRQVGFVESVDGRCGCSPDGLISEDEGIEIKCPQPQTHVGYLDKGKVPSDYIQQVHGSIYVTGRKRWHFFSYCPAIKKHLRVIVERDEEIMTKIGECLAEFYTRFDAALEKLK